MANDVGFIRYKSTQTEFTLRAYEISERLCKAANATNKESKKRFGLELERLVMTICDSFYRGGYSLLLRVR